MAHLQEAAVKQINEICERYKDEKTPLMMILSDIQKEYGYIPLEVQELVLDCREKDIGFIAMQPLCGGVVQNIPLALGFFSQFDSAVPVWGAHSQEELQQILYFTENPPVIDEKFEQELEKARFFFN